MKRKGRLFRTLIFMIDIALAVWIGSSYMKAKSSDHTDPSRPTGTVPTSSVSPSKTDSVSKESEEKTKEQGTSSEPEQTRETEEVRPAVPREAQEYLDRFSWYLNGVMTKGVPEGASQVETVSSLFGKWKVMLYYDPDGAEERRLFADAFAEAGQFGYLIRMDRDLTYDLNAGTVQQHIDTDSPMYTFVWDDNMAGIQVDDSALYLYCYEKDGRIYGVGAFYLADTTAVYVSAMHE